MAAPEATQAHLNVDDFLKPESMTTPGLAGGVAMLITNTLNYQFGAVQNYTCLILSFLLGTLVFAATERSRVKKWVLYLINSLIIFSMAMGTNAVGVKISNTDVAQNMGSSLNGIFSIVSTAYAEEGEWKLIRIRDLSEDSKLVDELKDLYLEAFKLDDSIKKVMSKSKKPSESQYAKYSELTEKKNGIEARIEELKIEYRNKYDNAESALTGVEFQARALYENEKKTSNEEKKFFKSW